MSVEYSVWRVAAVFFCALLSVCASRAAAALDVYTIDVEGGKSVPDGRPLRRVPAVRHRVAGAERPGRGPDRGGGQAAGLKQIDYLVISHYDVDHMGDVPLLVSRIPVKHVVDHGPLESSGKGVQTRYQAYAEARDKIGHIAVKPGDRIPLKGVDVLVVASAENSSRARCPALARPIRCAATTPEKPELTQDLEDNMSIGLLVTLGKFRMLRTLPIWNGSTIGN